MRDGAARAQLEQVIDMVGDLTGMLDRLSRRLVEVERRPVATLPHVVLNPGDMLVCTAPDDLTGPTETGIDPLAELRASVERAGLTGRVVIISESMRAEVARVALCACGSEIKRDQEGSPDERD
jgi:hypothetical protein